MARADNGTQSDTRSPVDDTGQQHDHADAVQAGSRGGAAIIDPASRAWGTVGVVAGWAVGIVLGLLVGYGRLEFRWLAPLEAGGPSVPAIALGSAFGAVGWLSGRLLGMGRTGRKHSDKGHGAHVAENGGAMSWIMRLPLIGTGALVIGMLLTLWVIAIRAVGTGPSSTQENREHWNLKNATRLGSARDGRTAPLVFQTVYPSMRMEHRPRVVLSVADDWRIALAATPLIAPPYDAAILIAGTLPARDAASFRARAREPDQSSLVLGNDPVAAAAEVDAALTAASGTASSNVLLVPQDGDPPWALPAAAYAARTGTPILFVARDAVPSATADALARRAGRAGLYILAPTELVSEKIAEGLRRYGTVTRVTARDPVRAAVRFAQFYDKASGFGWGRTGRGARHFTPSVVVLVNGARWQDAITAAHLERGGKRGPLLFAERDRLPAATEGFLWRQRSVFGSTPAEGPFDHVWTVGSFEQIGYPAQARADYAVEIEQYMTRGDSATSPFEALTIAWLFFAFASAIWIAVHARRRLPQVMPMMKAAWVAFALLMGPIAVWLYGRSYNRRPMRQHNGMTMWQRPPFDQAVSATVMMFSFDMLLMVLAVFALAYLGFPIIRSGGPLYWLGTSMFLMMVGMYLIALVLMLLVFHGPMTMHERRTSYTRALAVGLPLMAATMTVESLGMMPTMWWAQMSFLPGMQMPTEDDLTMWGTLIMAVLVAFLVVLPFNHWLVRRGRKMGGM
jgi:hypothetical protein